MFQKLAITLVSFSLVGALRADERQAFLAEYQTASDKLATAYSHVKIVAERTTIGKTAGTQIADLEYLREGDSVREVKTITKPYNGEVAGTEVRGGSRDKFFGIKKTTSDSFSIFAFGPNQRLAENVGTAQQLLCAPYNTYQLRISDYLKQKGVTITSIRQTTFNGEAAVQVVAESGTKALWGRDTYYFRTGSMPLVAATIWSGEGDDSGSVSQIRIAYDKSDPPKMVSMETWSEVPPGTVHSSTKYKIKSVEFGYVAPEKFTVADFGLEEPVLTHGVGFTLFLTINAVIFAGLGILFAWLRRRRRAA